MRDYAEVEAGLDEIIGTGGKYFNTLNFKRDALTFVENPRGDSVRCGKKGNWIVPNMPALSSASLRKAAAKADWFSVSGNKIKTPYYSADLNDDGSFASLFDKKRSREWVKGEFNKLKIFDDRPGNYDAWDILPNYREKEINTELAEKLDTSKEKIIDALNSTRVPLSLTAEYDSEGNPQLDVPTDDIQDEISERLSLEQAVKSLCETDRKIIQLRYYRSKTQTQTAKILSMTQVQISRQEKKILTAIRDKMSV